MQNETHHTKPACWEAAALSVDITPTVPVQLGAGPSGVETLTVDDPLELNLLAIWGDAPDPVVLATYDLLYVGAPLVDALVSALSDIPRENIFIAASHTHNAPMTDPSKPRLGSVNVDFLRQVISQTELAASTILDPSLRQKVTLHAGKGHAPYTVNRRLLKRFRLTRHPGQAMFNVIDMAPNLIGPTDDTLSLLELRSCDNGKPVATLWNYGAHPVGYPKSTRISAHFPGVVRNALRKETGDHRPVLFFQGFSGNVRPSATATVSGFKKRVRRALQGPVFQNFTTNSYIDWSESLSASALTVRNQAQQISAAHLRAMRRTEPLSSFADAGEGDVAFQAITLGDAAIVGVAGEVVAEYAATLEKRINKPVLLRVGCLDTPFGYIPTERMMEEGGYEGGGFVEKFSLQSLKAGLPKITERALLDLAGFVEESR